MSRVFRGLGLLVVERCGIVRRGGSCISAMCCLGCGTPCTSSTGRSSVIRGVSGRVMAAATTAAAVLSAFILNHRPRVRQLATARHG